jgi:hypothetical protein
LGAKVPPYRPPPQGVSKPSAATYWGANEPGRNGVVGPKPAPPLKEPSVWDPASSYPFQPYYDEDERVEGVFRQFLKQAPKEWHNYVRLTGGGTKDKMLSHLLEYDTQLYQYHWDNYDKNQKIKAANAWLQVEFRFHRLVITNYSIAMSVQPASPNGQPKSWKLEGSLDGNQWTLLMKETNSQKFRDQKQGLATFPVVPVPKIAYSHFRLTQLENFAKVGAPNYGEMRFNAIEFYGALHKT